MMFTDAKGLLRRLCIALWCIYISCYTPVVAQQNIEASFTKELQQANTDSAKLHVYSVLADYYFSSNQDEKGDSIIEKQLSVAEETGNTRLILKTLFTNPRYHFANYSSRKISASTIGYINNALEYARSHNASDYMAFAYAKLASCYQAQGKLDEAFMNADIAHSTALGSGNDSAKVVCALQLGSVYLQKSDAILAFKTYSQAFDVANHSQVSDLLGSVYVAIAQLYKKLDRDELAKSYAFKSLALYKESQNLQGIMDSYLLLGSLYSYHNSNEYLSRAEKLADSVKNKNMVIKAQRLIFINRMIYKKTNEALEYLHTHPLLIDEYASTGPNFMDWIIGEVFLYSEKYKQALPYFKKAEASFEDSYDVKNKKDFFDEMALCLYRLKDPSANTYLQKSIELSKKNADYSTIARYSFYLKDFYLQQGDTKMALYYTDEGNRYKDTINLLSKEKDLAFIEIENEEKRRAKAEELALIKKEREYNLQYMGITVVVASFFTLLIALGMFKVSKFTIRILGYFAFIFLFEFLLMLLEGVIHDITHGYPWETWLIKIGLISVLFQVHHYLEHKLIEYLTTKRQMNLHENMGWVTWLKRWFTKKTATPASPKATTDVADVVQV